MLTLTPPTSDIWLATAPTDMRKSFDALSALAAEHCQRNVLDGGLFLFLNKRRDRLKILWWDDDGLVLWCKRLEVGTFEVPAHSPDQSQLTLTSTQLALLLKGIELASVRERKRYRRPK